MFLFVFSTVRSERFHFRTVGSQQGLSQASAISIWQDPLGRMWFGNDALNCYNGETTEVYRVSEYFAGMEDADIHGICGGDSNLYFLAGNNVIGFDMITEKLFSTGVNALYIDVIDGKLFYTSIDGILFSYDSKTNTSKREFTLINQDLAVLAFVEDSDNTFWLATASGLYKVDLSTGMILAHYFKGDVISGLFKDSNGNLWVSSYSKNVNIIRPNGHVSSLVYDSQGERPFESEAYSFTEDSKGNVWIGTLNGIYQVIPPLREAPARVLEDVYMAEFSIYDLFTDRQGTIWIGSYYGEVKYFNPETDNYTLFSSNENESHYLHGVVLGDIVEDQEGFLYVSSEGSGVNIISPDRKNIKHLTMASHNLPHDKIRSLYYDSRYNRLYIGTYMEGLVYYDRKTDRIHNVKEDSLSTRHQKIIEKIIPFDDHLILLTQDGLFKLNRATLLVSPLFDDVKLRELTAGITRTIFLDDRNTLWVSSLRNGLFTIDMNSRKVLEFYGDGLSPESQIPSAVISICGNSKQGFFFATLKSGVLSYDGERKEFVAFTSKDNYLLSDISYNVALSPFGNLIVTSNKGVSILNVSGRQTVNYSSHIRLDENSPIMSLSPDCGLFVSPLNRNIYIGGLKKLISFNEKDISTIKRDYNLFISSVQVNNTQSSVLTRKTLFYLEDIVLPYDQNTIAIQFSSSNYLSSYYTEYEYKMNGLSGFEDWTRTDHKTVSFTSLPVGNYTFTIRETSDPEKTATFSIRITPPFWKSYFAYFVYLLLIVGLFWIYARSSRTKAVLKASLEFQKREADRVAEENKNRLNFFAGIANEFRTPLTLIIATLDGLLNDIGAVSKTKLERVRKQTLRMQNLFIELQEFREAENGLLRLKVGYYNITQFLNEIHEVISDYESTLQVTFNYYHPGNEIKVWFDLEQMQKVIYNLLFAISRLVHVKGKVELILQQRSSWIEIQISCLGDVYDEEMLLQLFDILENASRSTDSLDIINSLPNNIIGLALSRKIVLIHKGELLVRTEKERTSFIIRLQSGENHFKPEEKTGNSEVILRRLPVFSEIVDVENFHQEEEKSDSIEKRLKILLVNDDEEMITVFRDTFISAYEVLDASNAEDALGLAAEEEPDIIISEISLPGLSGVELCNRLKANVRTLQIPILLITRSPSLKQRNESIRAGADEYLEIPFDMEYLFLRCNSLVKNKANILQKYTGQIEEESQALATNTHDQRFLDKAIHILENNIEDTEFDTMKWSKELGIGRTRLFDRIKRITGMTPNDYILQIKMNKAMIMLQESDYTTIAEVAYKLGFSNPAYFSKCFKKQVGVTPQQYRKG